MFQVPPYKWNQFNFASTDIWLTRKLTSANVIPPGHKIRVIWKANYPFIIFLLTYLDRNNLFIYRELNLICATSFKLAAIKSCDKVCVWPSETQEKSRKTQSVQLVSGTCKIRSKSDNHSAKTSDITSLNSLKWSVWNGVNVTNFPKIGVIVCYYQT